MVQRFTQWKSKVTPQEREAVFDYAGSVYSDLNERLRKQQALTPEQETMVADIDSAMVKAPKLDASTTVYRALTLPKGVEVGDTFDDAAYVSTSLDKGTAEWFRDQHSFESDAMQVVEVELPEGLQGAYVDALAGRKNEQELLLPKSLTFQLVADGKLKVVTPQEVKKDTALHTNLR